MTFTSSLHFKKAIILFTSLLSNPLLIWESITQNVFMLYLLYFAIFFLFIPAVSSSGALIGDTDPTEKTTFLEAPQSPSQSPPDVSQFEAMISELKLNISSMKTYMVSESRLLSMLMFLVRLVLLKVTPFS